MDPIRTDFFRCDVWREIFMDNDPNDSIGGVHNGWQRDEAYQRANANDLAIRDRREEQ